MGPVPAEEMMYLVMKRDAAGGLGLYALHCAHQACREANRYWVGSIRCTSAFLILPC